jgi:Tat protein secretion system quality control protein TatD with DNase activity
VAEVIAGIHGIEVEEVVAQVRKNTRELFHA